MATKIHKADSDNYYASVLEANSEGIANYAVLIRRVGSGWKVYKRTFVWEKIKRGIKAVFSSKELADCKRYVRAIR